MLLILLTEDRIRQTYSLNIGTICKIIIDPVFAAIIVRLMIIVNYDAGIVAVIFDTLSHFLVNQSTLAAGTRITNIQCVVSVNFVFMIVTCQDFCDLEFD